MAVIQLMRMLRCVAPALFLSLAPVALLAQSTVPPNSPQATSFKDTSSLKPPPAAKVAVIEYEDLECPACAHAYPIVHAAVNHYHIPLEEYDFQIPGHTWSHQAAIFSHYLRDKVSPALADEFRQQTFAAQMRIASLDDLHSFEQNFMRAHGKQMPFVLDPSGQYDREVNTTTAAGIKLGVAHTPTIVVVTPGHWIEVASIDDMYAAIDQAEADAGHAAAAPTHHTATHK